MDFLYCHECKRKRAAEFEYDPVDSTMVITCNYCQAAWAFETHGAYQIKGPVFTMPRKEPH